MLYPGALLHLATLRGIAARLYLATMRTIAGLTTASPALAALSAWDVADSICGSIGAD